ncbi:VanZ family protein [Clostridium sp. 'deep sea']|uniref:VanZ family protein n=1 Tax=Clostridium sp. 'deep sea' TaxID=2779445 RepID=UPI0018966542|nr:VanZ family protein [Clostridium sp. 'deep sea']QOR35094.1 VanZ family protein [Clostridium sp. 'deep sea']
MRSILNDMLYMIPISLIVVPFYVIIRILQIKKNLYKGLKTTIYRELGFLGLLFTAIFLLSITIGLSFFTLSKEAMEQVRAVSSSYYNFVPFKTLAFMVNAIFRGFDEHSLINVVGNIIVFVPFGLFVSLVSQKSRLLKAVVCTALFSFSIEFLQLFVLRATDIDDIILNTLGGFIGYCVSLIFSRVYFKFWNYSYSKSLIKEEKNQALLLTFLQVITMMALVLSFVPLIKLYYR